MEVLEKNDGNYIEFHIEGKACLCFSLFHEYEEYFDEDLNPEQRREFFKLTRYEPLAILEHLEVYPQYRGKGLSSYLMNYFHNYIKNNNYQFVYLNASPCCDIGLEIEDLSSFYERNGYKIFKDQGSNKIMIKKFAN